MMLFRREELGQTKSTTINYLKNLRVLFQNILNAYIHMEKSFPKGFDLLPCQETVTKIKLLDHNLGLIYKKKTKQQPAELFIRKTKEADELPDYSAVTMTIKKIESGIPGWLSRLEERFGNDGTVNVRSEKSGTPAEKEVSVCGKTLA